MSLKSTPQVPKHVTSPTLCRRQKAEEHPSHRLNFKKPINVSTQEEWVTPWVWGRALLLLRKWRLFLVLFQSQVVCCNKDSGLPEQGRYVTSPHPSQKSQVNINHLFTMCLIAYGGRIDHWEFRIRCRKEQKLKWPTLVLFPFFLSSVPGLNLDPCTFSATVLSPLS